MNYTLEPQGQLHHVLHHSTLTCGSCGLKTRLVHLQNDAPTVPDTCGRCKKPLTHASQAPKAARKVAKRPSATGQKKKARGRRQ